MWQLFNCRECLTSFSTMTHQRTSTTDGGQTTLVKLREELSECEVSIGFKHFHFLKDVCLCTARQLQGVKILILDIFQCGVALSTAPKKAVERSTESSHLGTWTLGLFAARYGAPKLSVSTRVADGGDRHHVKHQTHQISPQTVSSDRN